MTEVTKIINTKKLEFNSKVRPYKGWMIVDNFTVRPRKNRTKDGYSYTFSINGWKRRIYVHHSFVKDGVVEFPIENAKAYEDENGIHIVPSEDHVVHFVMLGSVLGFEPHTYVNGNSVSHIPFIGYFNNAQINGSIITTRKGSDVFVEYGLVHYGFFREEWEDVKKVVEIKTG